MEAPSTTTSPATATLNPKLVTTPAPWPPILLWGARPLSLDAEVIMAIYLPPEEQKDGQPWRLILDCPKGNSSGVGGNHSRTPEEQDADDECLEAGLFPAELNWFRPPQPGDMETWLWTFLPASKTWRCEGDWDDWRSRTFLPMSGRCSHWESAGGESAAATTSLDQCDIMRQRVPVRETAGLDIWGNSQNASRFWDPPNWNAYMSTELTSAGCPEPTSLVHFAAAESAGAASRGDRAGAAALICVVLACASVATGLL